MKVAALDLDETLIAGDSASLFCEYLVAKGVMPQSYVDRDRVLMQLYSNAELSISEYIQACVADLPLSVAQIDAVVADFVDQVIEPLIYPSARALVKQLHKQDYSVVIISATAEFLVRPIAARFYASAVLAVELEAVDGRYTGAIKGVPTYQGGKVIRLNSWLAEQTSAATKLIAFSDSRNDIPLLERADKAVVVNPDAYLTCYAQSRDWACEQWQLAGNPIQPKTLTGLNLTGA